MRQSGYSPTNCFRTWRQAPFKEKGACRHALEEVRQGYVLLHPSEAAEDSDLQPIEPEEVDRDEPTDPPDERKAFPSD